MFAYDEREKEEEQFEKENPNISCKQKDARQVRWSIVVTLNLSTSRDAPVWGKVVLPCQQVSCQGGMTTPG